MDEEEAEGDEREESADGGGCTWRRLRGGGEESAGGGSFGVEVARTVEAARVVRVVVEVHGREAVDRVRGEGGGGDGEKAAGKRAGEMKGEEAGWARRKGT